MARPSTAALALLMTLPTLAQADVTWEADTARGMAVFEGLERAPGEIDIQPDPKGLHGDVYHFNIWDKPEGGKERCEAKGTRLTDGSNYRLTTGNTYWIGWRSMYGEGIREGRAWVALFQMHAYGVSGSGAPFVLRTLSDGVLHLQNNVMGTNIHIWNTPLVTNQWQSFVLRAHMSSVATEGWVELWYNGVRQTFINGQQRYYCPTHEDAPGTYNRLKWGIYRGGGNSGNWHAWMSRARIGTTYEDADPDDGRPPTPTPTPTPTAAPIGVRYEAELVPRLSVGAPTAVQSDSKNSGGKWMALLADGPGDFVEYTLSNVPAGVYDLWMKYKSHQNRGIIAMLFDGQPIGPESLDQYANPPAYPEIRLGTVRFESDGDHTLRQTVLDKNPAAGAYTASADLFTFVPDRVPPVIESPEDLVVEATGPDGAVVHFSATAVDDKDGDLPVTVTPASGSTFSLGTTLVTATATDASGNVGTETFQVTVEDTTAPTIRRLTASPNDLGAPNHKMVPVTIEAAADDAVDGTPSTRIVGVSSNEPADGAGDGHTASDVRVTGPMSLELRAERAGGGSGRVYTITVQSRDAAGNARNETVAVTVAHGRRQP